MIALNWRLGKLGGAVLLALASLVMPAAPALANGPELVLREKAAQNVREDVARIQDGGEIGFVRAAEESGERAPRAATAAAVTATFKCLPTCSTTDGRFLAIAGTGLDTLSPPELELAISVPAGSTSFDIGIFDGDGGE